MNVLLGLLFFTTILFLSFYIGFCGVQKKCIILTIITIACFFLFCCIKIIAAKKIDHIGQEIEDKKIIGYEDRIILIEEEGGIKIPWYVNVNEIYNDNYHIVVGGGSINIYYPKEECKTYSSQ